MRDMLEGAVTSGDLNKALETLRQSQSSQEATSLPQAPPPTPSGGQFAPSGQFAPAPLAPLPALPSGSTRPMPPASTKPSGLQRPMSAVARSGPPVAPQESEEKKIQRPLSAGSSQRIEYL